MRSIWMRTVDELRGAVAALTGEGLLRPAGRWSMGVPTAKLMERREAYQAQLARTLEFIKPAFNEEMRHGLDQYVNGVDGYCLRRNWMLSRCLMS
jgi:hypothetical protein